MTDQCTLLAQHGIPTAVRQALDDVHLPPSARLMMWHLTGWLDLVEWRELKSVTLAHEMRIKECTAGRSLSLLVERGYLDERPRRPGCVRSFRMPLCRRRVVVAKAA